MKTLEELYDEIMASDEGKRAFVEAAKAGSIVDYLSQQGCDATPEDLQEFFEGKAADDAPMEASMDELKQIAGGTLKTISAECGSYANQTCDCSDTCIRDCC